MCVEARDRGLETFFISGVDDLLRYSNNLPELLTTSVIMLIALTPGNHWGVNFFLRFFSSRIRQRVLLIFVSLLRSYVCGRQSSPGCQSLPEYR